jgi:hypothetical protein
VRELAMTKKIVVLPGSRGKGHKTLVRLENRVGLEYTTEKVGVSTIPLDIT